MLRDLTARPVTHDIDIFQADSIAREVIAQYPNINGAVAAYGDHIPYNFEDRLVPLNIGARAAKWCTPSTEDLVVMKLYAQRPNDILDIDGSAASGKLDWDLLEKLVYDDDEAKASVLSEMRYAEMVLAYEDFKARWLG